MKKVTLGLFALSFAVESVACGHNSPGHAGGPSHTVVRPDSVKWGPPPPSLPPGCEVAILVGDPRKPGPYVLRAKLPDGYVIPPHWHPSDENLTVVQGAFLVGSGDKLDPSATEPMPAGSFCHLSAGMRHFGVAKGETVIQTHGIGPFEVNYVHPADDPRK